MWAAPTGRPVTSAGASDWRSTRWRELPIRWAHNPTTREFCYASANIRPSRWAKVKVRGERLFALAYSDGEVGQTTSLREALGLAKGWAALGEHDWREPE